MKRTKTLITLLVVGLFGFAGTGLASAAETEPYDYASGILEESTQQAADGDEEAIENVEILSEMTDDEMQRFNQKMADGEFEVTSSADCEPTGEQAQTASSLEVTATCDQNYRFTRS